MKKTKYYRIGAFYRNDNSRSVIVQCHDRKEVENWIPRVKEMLYPEENTDGYMVNVLGFQLPINQHNLNHYRITVSRPIDGAVDEDYEDEEFDNSLYIDVIVAAMDENSAKEIFFDEWFEAYASGKQREEYDIYVDEVSLGELIETEERMLRNRLIYKYASESFGDMTVQEFSRIMQDDDSEEKNRMYYEGVKNLLKSLRLSEYIEERLDTSKMTHAEFLKIKDQLCSAKIGDEFEKINREAIEKYGKVGVYD